MTQSLDITITYDEQYQLVKLYETMLDRTTKSLEKILINTESISKIQ